VPADSAPRRHTRDGVALAALAILDEWGLADLTMRRLATSLDVQPSALYWHFPNKQSLLADLADRIVARVRPVAVTDAAWPEPVRAEAAALRDALLAYRDGAELVASTLALGLGGEASVTRLADAIAGGGFDAATSRRAAVALLHFVLGQVGYEQQRLQFDSLGVVPAGSALDDTPPHEAFAFGVDLFVTGLGAPHLGTRNAPPAPTGRGMDAAGRRPRA
jgi:TetR/AcrR family transcriptional regulator, tetracycline repressor protein